MEVGFGIYSEEKGIGLLAVMPTEAAAKKVIEQFEKDQDRAKKNFEETLRSLHMPLYGSGMEQSIDEVLVLSLGGRLI